MTDERDEAKRFDPRFDPAFQPGYDPRNDPAGAARGVSSRGTGQSPAPRVDPSAGSAFGRGQQQPPVSSFAPGGIPAPNPPDAPRSEPVSGVTRIDGPNPAPGASAAAVGEAGRGPNPFAIAVWVISVILIVGGIVIYRALPMITEQSSASAGAGNNFIQLFALGAIGAMLIGVGLVGVVGNLLILASRFARRS